MFMPRTIAKVIDKVARQSVGKDWSLYAALLNYWQEIVGADYARVTTPTKITFPHQPSQPRRSGGTLFIRLPQGLAMEFSFKTDQIRQRINSYFGYEAIGKIAFEPVCGMSPHKNTHDVALTPEAAEELQENTKSIDNSELQAALQSFGEAFLKGKAKMQDFDYMVQQQKHDG